MPRVSVILPVYNAEAHLREAIDSILNQTFRDFELLIYNDGSSDGSEQIIKSYGDERIIYKPLPENKGLIYVLNQGLTEATGEYLARMDADDQAFPERFKKQVEFMDMHPEIGVCGTQLKLIDDGKPILKPCDDEDLRWWIFKGAPLAHPSVVIRNSVLKTHGLQFDPNAYVAEDFDLWWRMAFHCKLANLPDCLLAYRVHDLQESSSKSKIQYENHRKSLENFISELGLSNKHKPELIAGVLDKSLSLSAGNLKYSFNLFNDLLNSRKAVDFFGIDSISAKKDACLSYQIQNMKQFDWSLLPFLADSSFRRLLKVSNVSALSFMIKSIIFWKTR